MAYGFCRWSLLLSWLFMCVCKKNRLQKKSEALERKTRLEPTLRVLCGCNLSP